MSHIFLKGKLTSIRKETAAYRIINCFNCNFLQCALYIAHAYIWQATISCHSPTRRNQNGKLRKDAQESQLARRIKMDQRIAPQVPRKSMDRSVVGLLDWSWLCALYLSIASTLFEFYSCLCISDSLFLFLFQFSGVGGAWCLAMSPFPPTTIGYVRAIDRSPLLRSPELQTRWNGQAAWSTAKAGAAALFFFQLVKLGHWGQVLVGLGLDMSCLAYLMFVFFSLLRFSEFLLCPFMCSHWICIFLWTQWYIKCEIYSY